MRLSKGGGEKGSEIRVNSEELISTIPDSDPESHYDANLLVIC